MNFWWMVFLAGLGTYLMRSAGAWVSPRLLQADWLNQIPFAIILVMAVGSLASLLTYNPDRSMQPVATLIASAVVIAASLRKIPLVLCIILGCVVFGAIAPLTP